MIRTGYSVLPASVLCCAVQFGECCHVETQQNNKTLLLSRHPLPQPGLGVVRLAVLQPAGHGGEGGRDWTGGREESEAGDQAGGRRTRQTARLCSSLLSLVVLYFKGRLHLENLGKVMDTSIKWVGGKKSQVH